MVAVYGTLSDEHREPMPTRLTLIGGLGQNGTGAACRGHLRPARERGHRRMLGTADTTSLFEPPRPRAYGSLIGY
jgi:hypothetical protein